MPFCGEPFATGQGAALPSATEQGAFGRETPSEVHSAPLFQTCRPTLPGAWMCRRERVWAGMAPKPAALMKEFIFVAALDMRESQTHRPPLGPRAIAGCKAPPSAALGERGLLDCDPSIFFAQNLGGDPQLMVGLIFGNPVYF